MPLRVHVLEFGAVLNNSAEPEPSNRRGAATRGRAVAHDDKLSASVTALAIASGNLKRFIATSGSACAQQPPVRRPLAGCGRPLESRSRNARERSSDRRNGGS